MIRADWRVASWQGYCAQGDSIEDQKKRLEQVPAEFKEEVRRHLVTVFKINKRNSKGELCK